MTPENTYSLNTMDYIAFGLEDNIVSKGNHNGYPYGMTIFILYRFLDRGHNFQYNYRDSLQAWKYIDLQNN